MSVRAQRSSFRHSFMMNSSSNNNNPCQDDMLTDGLDQIDCNFIFECLGHVNSEMDAAVSSLPPMPTLPPPPVNNKSRAARNPTKKSSRIPSSPKEKSPRASRPKANTVVDPSTAPTSSFHYDDDCENDDKNDSSKLSSQDMKNEQQDRRR